MRPVSRHILNDIANRRHRAAAAALTTRHTRAIHRAATGPACAPAWAPAGGWEGCIVTALAPVMSFDGALAGAQATEWAGARAVVLHRRRSAKAGWRRQSRVPAAFIDHATKLAPGETGVCLVLAASKSQASVVFGHMKGFFEASPLMHSLVVG